MSDIKVPKSWQQLHDENEKLRARLAEATAIIKKAEWANDENGDYCVVCNNLEEHAPDCKLAAWLAEVKK